MNREQEFLLMIIRDHLHRRASGVDDSTMHWDQLKKIARSQQLSAIVYIQTKNELLRADYYQQIIRNKWINKEVCTFREIMKGIEHCFLKGVCIKDFYPVPMLRSMGDIDVLIRPESRLEVHNRLLENGYIFCNKWKEQWTYKKNDILLEVHDCAIFCRETDDARGEFASDVWNYVENNDLNWNFHFFYVLFHLRRHLVSRGVGFRQFMDVAVLCNGEVNLDWPWILKKAEELDILRFMETVFAFNEKTFDIKSPIAVPELDDEFYQYVLQKIFDDGVFGFDNPDNREKEILQIMRNKNVGERVAKLCYLLNKIFPPYEAMCECHYIGYLEGRKYLLCFAWIHRGIHGLCRDAYRKNLKDKLTYMHTDTATIHKQKDYLARWGI